MTDPLNQLPVDPDWLRRVNAIGDRAATELQAMTLLVAIQEGGKLAIVLDGVPEGGMLRVIAEDGVPKMLAFLSMIAAEHDAAQATETRQ